MSPHRCANMVIDGVPIMVLLLMVHVIVACHLLSIVVYFILLFSIYIVFYFELADDTYSVRVPCTDPYLYFLLCSFVECIDIPWFHGIIITFSLSLVCPKAFLW